MYRHRIAKAVVALTALLAPAAASAQDYNVHHSGDTVIAEVSEKAIFVRTSGDTTIVEITNPKRFIFLPVEKDKPEVKQLLFSLLQYMNSISFRPTGKIEEEALHTLLLQDGIKQDESNATSIYN